MIKVVSTLLLALGGSLQLGIGYLGFRGTTFPLLSFLHLFSCTLFFIAIYQHFRAQKFLRENLSLLTYALLVCIFFPFFGFCGVLLMGLMIGWGRRRDQIQSNDEDYELDLEPAHQAIHVSSFRAQRSYRREVGFESYIDILQGESIPLKIKTIEKLTANLVPENVSLIRVALKDHVPDVRLCAAAGLQTMEENVTKEIRAAKAWVKQTGAASDYAALGRLYFRYAVSDILSSSLAHYYLGLSVAAFQNSLNIRTDQPTVVIRYARALLKFGDVERARRMIEGASKAWSGRKELLFLKNELNFRLGEFDRLEEGFKEINVEKLQPAEKEVYEYWTKT